MLEEGSYILSHVGFSGQEEPLLIVQKDTTLLPFRPLGARGTISFNTSIRFCVGWHDITTGETHICPSQEMIDTKYEQCAECQKRTGFNPAFYHATSISEQQQARNQEPHALYLAYFGQNHIKVGITHAKRGNRRLLEQGARCALLLETFPTALIARQYEAKIAALSKIAESIQLRKKIELLNLPYSNEEGEQALIATQKRIQTTLNVTFTGRTVIHFTDRYICDPSIKIDHYTDTAKHHCISGKVIGMIGTLLLAQQNDTGFVLPVKKYIGYTMTISSELTSIDTPARQTSLF